MAFRFEKLEIWKDALIYSRNIYKILKNFPKEELFVLVDQLKRSAGSVPANIAEGAGSISKKEFLHHLDIAIKSLYETVSHLQLAKNLEYISERQRGELYNEAERLVKKMQNFRHYLLNRP